MIAAFVRVNVDDEVYVQAEAGNTSSELVRGCTNTTHLLHRRVRTLAARGRAEPPRNRRAGDGWIALAERVGSRLRPRPRVATGVRQVLARIYHGRVWEQLDATAQCELECLERGFHQWLGEVLRVLLAAIQMRKKQASGNAR